MADEHKRTDPASKLNKDEKAVSDDLGSCSAGAIGNGIPGSAGSSISGYAIPSASAALGSLTQPSSVRLIAILLSALLFALSARAEVQTPEDAMRAFYSWVLAHPSQSLPVPKERAHLARVLSPQLVQLLKEASETEARCVKVTPKGDKPNILEGNLFVGNYEGATEVAYGHPLRDGEVVFFEADLLYVDSRFPKAHKHRAVAWKDRLELRWVGARWLVQDVKFQQGKSLVAGLKEYIAEGTRSCVKP